MIIIQFLRWAYKVLNGEQRPWQIALGFALGIAFGLIPFGMLTLIGLIVMLLINCHFGSAIFGLIVGVALSLILDSSVLYPFGGWIIETGPHGLFLSLAESNWLSLLRLHQNATMGGLAIGTLSAPLVFFAARTFVVKARGPVQKRLGKSKLAKALSNTFIFKSLKWVFIGR